ncbi:MAG TPA: copper-binding protein [Methylomirabilota bacterium]|nr:copper-binding protein [Methylomirabilota bacterium]
MSDSPSEEPVRQTSSRPWLVVAMLLLVLGLVTGGLLMALTPAKGTWRATGVVEEVGQTLVLIRHETIPGLMEGHSMDFFVESKNLLDGIRPGDRVRFTLKSTPNTLLVVRLEKQ